MAKQQAAPQSSAAEPAPTEGYTVLARRYRPQQLTDLVGQEPVARALANALQSNRVAHAYLFTGPRGVGKTSAARILAKALNCVQGPTPTPCDACDSCLAIAAGEDLDVLEIDGASNNSVDDVRELRQNAQFRPSRSRHKIYIIDEVHMLGASAHKSAFNALLKTLEEPPPHVKFIFATTEIQKIPATILSRCQRFDFAGIGTPHILNRLRQVVKGEGMQADDEALGMIARRAGGSMRDAQSLLDQLLAFGGDRLTSDQVHQLLGTAPDDRVVELAAAVLERDPKKALALLAQTADQGLQLGELLDQLMAYWRDLMVVHCAGNDAQDLSVTARHREGLTRQAASLSLDTILAGLDILSAAKARLRGSHHGRTLLEMVLVRLGRLDDLVSLSQLSQWLGQAPKAEERGPKVETSRPAVAPGGLRSALAGSRPADSVAPPEAVKKKPLTPAPEPVSADTAVAITAESLPHVWSEVLAQVAVMLRSHLEKAGLPAISGPNALVFRFPTEYNQHREFCQGPERLARVEEILRKMTGRDWKLRVESVSDDGMVRPAPFAEGHDNSPSRSQRQRHEAEKEPLVKRALDVLEAQIVRVDDGFAAVPTAAADLPEAADAEES